MNLHHHRHEKGFSTIGLIVTLSIIGVLSAGITTASDGTHQISSIHWDNGPLVPSTNSVSSNGEPAVPDIENSADLSTIQSQSDRIAGQMELQIVQTAMDTMMIYQGFHTIGATAKTNDMTAFPAAYPLYPQYLRDPQSRFYYTCDSTGQVFQGK